ncbi:chloride channel protein, partial [Candidatus Entotheonella serta]
AISIGSGFRGGLFFASLLLGAVAGKLFAIIWLVAFGLDVPIVLLSVVGMCAMATAIIGAPLTMSLLALETTASLPLTLAVLISSLIATATVRRLFGFSFATWRFHLRGEAIRSAADIGWLRELSVGRLVRRHSPTMPATITLAEGQRRVPLGSTKYVALVDDLGGYT